MDVSGDDIAGVVDLFGGLTRGELADALAELAFKRGEEHDPGRFGDDIDDALASYHLVRVEDERSLLVAGPVAFPTLPDGARDLPHILDVETRTIDRETAGQSALAQFQSDAEEALDRGDRDRIERLLDVSYELEAWASVDVTDVRERLDAGLSDQ